MYMYSLDLDTEVLNRCLNMNYGYMDILMYIY